MKVTQWVVGCCAFAVERSDLWDAKCLTLLEKLDLAMAKRDAGDWLNLPLLFGCGCSSSHQFMPVMCWRGCKCFLCLLSSQGSAEQSVAQLADKGGVVPPKVQLSPSFPVFLLSLLILPKRDVVVTQAAPGPRLEVLELRMPCSPALRSLTCLAFLLGHIFTCCCPHIAVLWLLRYHFTCTFPSQARLAGSTWCGAEQRLRWDFTEMPRVSNVPSSGVN